VREQMLKQKIEQHEPHKIIGFWKDV